MTRADDRLSATDPDEYRGGASDVPFLMICKNTMRIMQSRMDLVLFPRTMLHRSFVVESPVLYQHTSSSSASERCMLRSQ